MTRAAIYARVSSQAQRERDTIESQLRALPAFVRQQGWALVGTYVDDGLSARTGKLDKRDGFRLLAADAEAGKFDVLVVVDIDRLTRTDDMVERAKILGPFQRAGVRIVTPSGGELDLRTMFGELYATLQAIFAAEENKKRARRTVAGGVRTAQDGGKPRGRTPYGLAYDKQSKVWSLDPERADHVREIFRRVAKGDSCGVIADDFHARGVPAPVREWTRLRVSKIVKARYPVGEWVAIKASRIVVRVPPMIDERTWQAAQRGLQANKQRSTRRTRHVYLLEELGVCSCGEPMYIRSKAGRHPARYICRSRKLARKGRPSKCQAPSVVVADADARVWEKVREELMRPDLADNLQAKMERRAANSREWKKDAAKYRASLDRLARAEDAFMTRYRKGLVSETALDTQLESLRKERAFLMEQLATAEAAPDAIPSGSPDAWLAALRTLADAGTKEAQRRVVRAVVKLVAFKGTRMALTMRLGEASAVESPVMRSATKRTYENTLTIRVVT